MRNVIDGAWNQGANFTERWWKLTIEQRIKKYFEDHHMFQSAYADKSNISQSRFYRILNGKTKMTADEFDRLSKALGVTMDEMSRYGDKEAESV